MGRRGEDVLLLFVCFLFHPLPRPGLGHALGCCLPLLTFSFLLPWATGLLFSALSESHGLTWAGLPSSREALWQPHISSLLVRANQEAGLLSSAAWAQRSGRLESSASCELPG